MKNITLETATTLFRQGQLDQAKAQCDALLESFPDDARVMHLLADTLEELGRWAEAEKALEQAAALGPTRVETLHKLGLAYLRQQKYMQAAMTFLAAIQIQEDFIPARFSLGVSLWKQGNPSEAIDAFRQTIARQHDFTQAHLALANALLALGEYEEGWRELEWRHYQRANPPVPNARPRWDGMLSPGGTLLIHADDDIGDTLLACRYLPFISEKEVHVVLQCDRKLVPLMASIPGLDRAIDKDTPLPYHEYQLPLLSLPRLFATRVDSIPANIPYLKASEAKINQWREKLSAHEDKIRIGLRWSDLRNSPADAERSIPLEMLEQLAGLPHVIFVSLQDGAQEDVEKLREKIPLLDFSDGIEDFADMAALMTNLNLTISVDTEILHLAGALGLNAWGLLPYVADWPWIGEGHFSLWYPKTTLFKQRTPGNWQEVMLDVKGQLLAAIPSDL